MQIGDGLVEMECLDDNLHFATEGCLVYVFLAPEQVWLDIAVLAGQVAVRLVEMVVLIISIDRLRGRA